MAETVFAIKAYPGQVFTYTGSMVIETCPDCHMPHAIPEELYSRALQFNRAWAQEAIGRHSVTIYCPNGHPWEFTGKTEEQKRLDRLERDKNNLNEALAATQDALNGEKRAHAATKGKLTRTRKRADAGVCQHCHRTFANVARHVASQHSDEPSPREGNTQ